MIEYSTADIESQIIGVILTRPGTINEATTLLPDSDPFIGPNEKKVYGCLIDLKNGGYDTDLMSANHALIKKYGAKDSFGLPWIVRLTSYVSAAKGAATGLTYKCQIVWQEYCRIKTGMVAQELLIESGNGLTDGLDLLRTAIRQLTDLQSKLSSSSDVEFITPLREAAKIAREAYESGSQPGIPTGISDLDRILKNLQPATLHIMAGRPAMGKTALLCQILYNVGVKQGKHIAFFSLEMNNVQLSRRFLSIETGIKNAEMQFGTNRYNEPIDFDSLDRAAEKIGSNKKIKVFDRFRTMPQIKNKVAQLVAKLPPGEELLVAIDYLQLAKTGNKKGSEQEDISEISRELKEITNTYNLPLIALCQLSRACEDTPTKRPELRFLRSSGAIEQDADTVTFLYRPGYYFSQDKDGYPIDPNKLLLIVGKNRSGSTHNEEEGIEVDYDQSTNRITDKPYSYADAS